MCLYHTLHYMRHQQNLNSKGKQCKMPLEIHLHQIISLVMIFLKNAVVTHGFKKAFRSCRASHVVPKEQLHIQCFVC